MRDYRVRAVSESVVKMEVRGSERTFALSEEGILTEMLDSRGLLGAFESQNVPASLAEKARRQAAAILWGRRHRAERRDRDKRQGKPNNARRFGQINLLF